MYKMKRIISIVLVIMLVLSVPLTTFADKPDFGDKGNNGKGNSNWKDDFKLEKNEGVKELEDLIEDLEELFKEKFIDLKLEYDEVTGYMHLSKEELLEEIIKLKNELVILEESDEFENTVKSTRFYTKKMRNELRKLTKNKYSNYEKSELDALRAAIESKYAGLAVLDVDSIISENIDFKLDTPPVIKNGRTLIPVAAIARGMGAEVTWMPAATTPPAISLVHNEEVLDLYPKVTIVKGDMTIEIWIGYDYARVTEEGESPVFIQIDAYAEIINSRTIVPLRFISETLGLHVNWDPGDKSIMITDVKLTTINDNFKIINKKIYVTEATTRAVLDASLVLEEPSDGYYVIANANDIISVGDKVMVYSAHGTLLATYSIKVLSSDTSLAVSGAGFELNGFVVTIPGSTTAGAITIAPGGISTTSYEELSNALSTTGGSITLLDYSKTPYDFDFEDDDDPLKDDLVRSLDVILVTAEDGINKQEYTIEFK